MATRSSRKPKLDDLQGQADPKAPLDWQLFLSAAQPVLKLLNDDLRARAKASGSVAEALQARHGAEREQKRTADSFVEWQDHFIEQVAAAWLLSCVFVRTLEDRGLLGHARLAGPGAADSLKLFLDLAPSLNERDYLLTIFRELTRFPATRELFDARHNPVWLLTPSAEGAKALVQLFQQPRADVPAFRFGQSDTGFLGWIYQDLDAGVRERFALLQTPRFIESFILDRTLEPAIEKFGLDDTTLIDPTCGSGHFLLGAFERLFEHRQRKEPGLSTREAARKALDAVYGADLNPYAVGIARFRLTLVFLDKAGFTSLSTAPALPLHVVVGDSLLHNPHVSQPDFADLAPSTRGWRGEEFALEDEAAAREVLHRKYAAVVGNPPYITVKDAVLREEYRKMYPRAAAGKYSIAAPFTERFFQLGRDGGRIGMITANSFMKREFGKKLIEQSLPAVNLDLVINTSGAYIPGHGTPTVLLFGSAEPPQGTHVATVLASRGEPSTPEDPEQGLVWRSIADHWSEPGFENEFISVAKTERTSLAKHPWSLGGGGAAELKELIEERASTTLGQVAESVGVGGMSNADDVYIAPRGAWARTGMPAALVRPLVIGEDLRDWSHNNSLDVYFPYSAELDLLEPRGRALQLLWPYRTTLWSRAVFGGGTYRTAARTWWEWHQVTKDRYRTPLTITFAEVATHNHFVLDRGGKVFKQTAPIIKLPDTATEDDHLALLAYLNSSTACFWMKQVFQPKHSAEHKTHPEPERNRFQFGSTQLGEMPFPTELLHDVDFIRCSRMLDELAHLRRRCFPPDAIAAGIAAGDLSAHLRDAWRAFDALRERMIALQEEIDWRVYEAFDLAPRGLCAVLGADSACPRGARVCEQISPRKSFVRARDHLVPLADAEFAPVGPLTADLEVVWARRTAAVRASPLLTLLEHPLYKRQWRDTDENVDEFAFRARMDRGRLEAWLLDNAERVLAALQTTVSMRELASSIEPASDVERVAAVLTSNEHDHHSVSRSLYAHASVPFLAALRHSESGLERLGEWEDAWDLQRREDAGEKIDHIPVPPKYGQGDYRSTTSWQLRGPLDVPKERFISYPGCESDQDKEPVYGWAGWDHEQRAKALATLYWKRKTEESWGKDRLTPMLAGLLELLPWLQQWHGANSDEYAGDSPANYYAGFLDAECRALGLTHDDLRAWRPAVKVRGKKAAAKAEAATSDEAAGAAVGEKPKKRARKKKAAADPGAGSP